MGCVKELTASSSLICVGRVLTFARSVGFHHGGQCVDVGQECLGKGHDSFCLIGGEIVVFMNRGVAIESNLFGPVGHVPSKHSFRGELFESSFQLPRAVKGFCGKVHSFAAKQDTSLQITLVKVFLRFDKCARNFFWYVVRCLRGCFGRVRLASNNATCATVRNVVGRLGSNSANMVVGVVVQKNWDDYYFLAVGAGQGDVAASRSEHRIAPHHTDVGGTAMRAVVSQYESWHLRSLLAMACLVPSLSSLAEFFDRLDWGYFDA